MREEKERKQREKELMDAHELGQTLYTYGQEVLWDRWHREPTEVDIINAWSDGEIVNVIDFMDAPMDDPAWRAFFRAGINNLDAPRYITGWRYGNIPACGTSYNFRDGQPERGISLMAIDDPDYQMTDAVKMFEVFNSKSKKIRVEGWLIGYGADGEPLIVDAEEINE